MSKILIVHAHPEEHSFSSALAKAARDSLEADGHEVVFKDLYREGFNPVSGRHNFSSESDPDYFKQQSEERHATETNGFTEELESEIQELESADAIIFSFPLWWFSMPAILKGWVDRVFAAGRIYGGGKLYENGIGGGLKRAKVLMTTGGPADMYDGFGLNPNMEHVLSGIEHGIFWFNGFRPLAPNIAWGPARWSQEEREAHLKELGQEMKDFFAQAPRILPSMSEFDGVANDRLLRTRVIVRRARPVDEDYKELVPAELNYLRDLKRRGLLLDFKLAEQGEEDLVAFLDLRTKDKAEVESILAGLPLDPYFSYEKVSLTKAVL